MRGCLEPYVNAAALIRYAGNSHTTAAQVIAAANAGEQKANEALRALACHLARGCATLVAVLDPQALILGGGLIENNPVLITVLSEELMQLVRPSENRALRIIPSELGYHGGVLGAAALAFEHAFHSTPDRRDRVEAEVRA
jgi:glucokinase